MYHWTARGLLVLGMISLLLPGKFSQAQRNSSGKAITLQPGQTITIQLSGSEFNDLTDVRVVTIGRRPAPANVVRASLGRQTRAGRPLRLSANASAKPGQRFGLQAVKGESDTRNIPYEIRIVASASGENKSSRQTGNNSSQRAEPSRRGKNDSLANRNPVRRNADSRTPDRGVKTPEPIVVTVANGRGSSIRIDGRRYGELRDIRLMSPSNRSVASAVADAKLSRSNQGAVVDIKINNARAGTRLKLSGRTSRGWTDIPISVVVAAEDSQALLSVGDVTLLTRDRRGRLLAQGPGQGTTTVRMPDGSVAVIGPDRLAGTDDIGMSNPDVTGDADDVADSPAASGPMSTVFEQDTTGYRSVNSYLLCALAYLIYEDDIEDRTGQGSEWQFESVKFIENVSTDAQAAVLSTPELIVVAFRGTEGPNQLDVNADINAEMVTVPHYGIIDDEICAVHEGFNAAMVSIYASVRSRIETYQDQDQSKPIFVTGHSLGGAMAELFAFKYKVEQGGNIGGVYTFGAPRVGNHVLRTLYDQKGLMGRTHEVTNPQDPVPTVPFSSQGFTHVGNTKEVNYGGIAGPITHHMAYLDILYSKLSSSQKSTVPSPPGN